MCKNRKRFWGILLGCSLVAGLFAGCGGKVSSRADVLTQKPMEAGRTSVTVLVKHAFTINAFERVVEEKFPEINLIQVNNYTRNMGMEEYKSRLIHDDLPDMVMTWPLDVGEEYWEDRLMDLSGFDFTSRYHLSMLNDISRDGKLYYLPGPSQIRGIVYNKTMFEEHGWEVPSDFEGFLTLCQEIEASGIRSLQLGFANEEVLDTAFIGYGFADCYSQPDHVKWIREYNEGEHRFREHFDPALETFQRMVEAGVWKPEDLTIDYAKREQMLFTRQCAMVEDSALLTGMGQSRTGITDEFALMPFFNPGQGGDWTRLYMVCYVGLNKHLEEPRNKKQYDLVMKLMDFISTQEGQEALMGDTGAMFSSLTGVAPSGDVAIQALLPALENGRFAAFPQFEHAQGGLREGLRGMLQGELTKEEAAALVDRRNTSPVLPPEVKELGEASEDFTLTETGNFIADCLRAYSGSQIALFLDNGKDGMHNGKGVSGRIYQGSVTQTDIQRILPDLKHGEKGTLWVVNMSGEDLLKTLEYTVEVDNGIGGWFYYISGLTMEYDVQAEPGSRIRKVALADKKAIDLKATYRVAVMDETVPKDSMESYEDTGKTIAEIVSQAVEQAQIISPEKDGRFLPIHGGSH